MKLFTRSVRGCVETPCRPDMKHRACVVCVRITDGSAVVTEPGTFRRKKVVMCTDCKLVQTEPSRGWWQRQDRVEAERRNRDLEAVTVDPQADHVELGSMPDQYPGAVRDAIRVLLGSDVSECVVVGVSATALNESLRATGQSGAMFAEVRDGVTVLRKVV